MSVYDYVYYDPARAALDTAFWERLARSLFEVRLGLFWNSEGLEWDISETWRPVSGIQSPPPKLAGALFCDRPGSQQAGVMVSSGDTDDNEVRTLPWPRKVVKLLRSRSAHIIVQAQHRAEQAELDFFVEFVCRAAVLLDGVIDDGDRLTWPAKGEEYVYPEAEA